MQFLFYSFVTLLTTTPCPKHPFCLLITLITINANADSLAINQVNNRDISIAVLRTYISKRKEEHTALLSKKAKVEYQTLEEGSSEPVPEEATGAHDEKPNGGCEVQMQATQEEPIDTSKEPLKSLGGKVRKELKPPRVLEVWFFFTPY